MEGIDRPDGPVGQVQVIEHGSTLSSLFAADINKKINRDAPTA